jgi:hypothetical protein
VSLHGQLGDGVVILTPGSLAFPAPGRPHPWVPSQVRRASRGAERIGVNLDGKDFFDFVAGPPPDHNIRC